MLGDQTHSRRGTNTMAATLDDCGTAQDPNIKGLTADMLFVPGGSKDRCSILSKRCDLSCIIADVLLSQSELVKLDCKCYPLTAERPRDMRHQKLPRENCKLLSLKLPFLCQTVSQVAGPAFVGAIACSSSGSIIK